MPSKTLVHVVAGEFVSDDPKHLVTIGHSLLGFCLELLPLGSRR